MFWRFVYTILQKYLANILPYITNPWNELCNTSPPIIYFTYIEEYLSHPTEVRYFTCVEDTYFTLRTWRQYFMQRSMRCISFTEPIINSPAHLPESFLLLSALSFLDLAPLNLQNLRLIPIKNSSGIWRTHLIIVSCRLTFFNMYDIILVGFEETSAVDSRYRKI